MRVMSLVHEVLNKGIHVTKRDLFYTDAKVRWNLVGVGDGLGMGYDGWDGLGWVGMGWVGLGWDRLRMVIG